MTEIGNYFTLKTKLNERLKIMFESETANSEPAIFESVRKLYSSCMDQDQIEKDGRFLILQKIQELGGWPVLQGPMNADMLILLFGKN